MKTITSLAAILVITFSAIAIAAASSDSNDGLVSVLADSAVQPSTVVQDEAVKPPIPVEAPEAAVVQEPVPAVETVPAVEPVAQDPVAPVPADMPVVAPSVLMDSVVMDQMVMGQPMMASSCCQSCCATPCCCPPAPVNTTFCLVDPCGCSHQAPVCVPGCCAGEEPCITWRKGIFGRQIATMCWKCCGHKVTVIVCRSGRVKVRG
jgi:hypothetical protein